MVLPWQNLNIFTLLIGAIAPDVTWLSQQWHSRSWRSFSCPPSSCSQLLDIHFYIHVALGLSFRHQAPPFQAQASLLHGQAIINHALSTFVTISISWNSLQYSYLCGFSKFSLRNFRSNISLTSLLSHNNRALYHFFRKDPSHDRQYFTLSISIGHCKKITIF